MSKISTYEVVPVPKLSDKLIGTSVGGEIEDVTYNFTLQELLDLYIPLMPANNLQGILDFGNTATQDINLFGTINTTNLDVSDTANLFITYLNEETHIVGSLFDSADSIGTAGQVLTSTGDGVEWYTLPPIFTPNLQQVLAVGNTADIDILLDANLEALDVSSNTANIANNLTLGGTITDNNSSVGGSGQVLESTGTGLQWVDLPVYSATSPLLFNSITKTFSIQPANSTQGGYLTANDWITFNGKQDAGSYITALTGEATATGPGSVPITLNNASVIAKVLTGLNITGGSISASDSILTAFGKVQNQINGLIGGVQYQGTWDAATNSPFLQSSVGVQGHFYIVSVAGNTDLNGITDWKVGDWAIFSAGAWSKVDNTESVTSVNGQIGAVSLTTDDIPEGATNLYYLDSRARAALSFSPGSGAYNSLTGVITIPTDNNQILNGAGYITLASLSASAPLAYNNLTGGFSIQKSDATHDGYLSSTDWTTFNNKQNYLGGTGLVKSTAGTITYITDNSTDWNTAYDRSIVSAAVTGTSTKTLTLTEQDGNTIQASWTDLDTGLTSVGVSMPSAFTVTNSPLTANGTIAITGAGTSLQYIDGTGALQNFPGLTGFVPYTGANQNVDLGEYGISAGYFQADLTPSGALQVGRMQWNATDGTMDLRLLGNNVTLQIGEENVTRVVNKSGIDLLEENYQVVRLRKVAEGGAQGQRIAVVLAQGNSENNSTEVLGLVTETILANQEGFITCFGEVKEINTTGSLQGETWVDGDILYLSNTVAGGLTNVRPVAPNHSVTVGYVSYAHAVHGKIYMAIDTGYELGELHNVYAPNPNNNESIYWNTTNGRYQLNTIAGILGYTPANDSLVVHLAGTETITGAKTFTTKVTINTGGTDDQLQLVGTAPSVRLTNAVSGATINGFIAMAGATNNYIQGAVAGDMCIGNQNNGKILFGFGSGTATQKMSLDSSGNAVIAGGLTLGGNITKGLYNYTLPSASGTLALTSDLTGFVTAVTASGPLSSSGGTAPNISIQQANTSQDGYLSSTDWNTFNNKQAAGNYITSLTGEATASGPGAASVTLNNASVTGKILTGVNITGGSISATDTMLTAFGKLQNQINGLIGSTIYQGTWNASTNTPTLTSSVGTRGYYYIVNVAGTTNLNGITDWQVGDWAIFDGTAWQKVDNTDAVSSVNGQTGAVSLTTDNIPEGTTNLYFTNTRARNAISLTTVGSSGAATYSGGVLNIPNYGSALTAYVPYTGATGAVNLGPYDLTVNSVVVGKGAGTGGNNVVLGDNALSANTTGSRNVAIGTFPLWKNTTGVGNIAIGAETLINELSGNNNIAIGDNTAKYITTGSSNTIIGPTSNMDGLTTGSYNTIIGGALTSLGNISNNIILADGQGNIKYRWNGTNNYLYGNTIFSSTISNGTYTYTLPGATGTLALTSDIPSLSGYISGAGTANRIIKYYGTGTVTTASASNISDDGTVITLNASGSYLRGVRVYNDMSLYNTIFFTDNNYAEQASINGSAGVLTFYTNGGQSVSGNILALSLGTTGTANFAKRVNVNGASDDADIALHTIAPSGAGKYIFVGRDSASQWRFSVSSSGDTQIGAPQAGSTYKLLTLSSAGNNLDTGTVLRLIGNAALDLVDISIADTVTRIYHQENAADAANGYGWVQIRTNAVATPAAPLRGGFKVTIDTNDALIINNLSQATFSSSVTAVGLKTNGGGSVNLVPTSYGANGAIAFRNIADNASRWNIYNYTGGGTTYGSLNFSTGDGTDKFVINEGGSAVFSNTVQTNGVSIGVAATANVLVVRGENAGYDGSITIGARSSILHRDAGETILSIANDYNSNGAKMEFRMKGNTSANSVLTLLGSGAATFSSTIAVGAITSLTPSGFGYDTNTYKVVIVGTPGTSTNKSIAFGVDVSGNPSGAFSGLGSEYIWKNSGSFITPNSINNGYNTLLSWNSSGQVTIANLVATSLSLGSNIQIGDYTNSTSITFASSANGIAKINFYDSNNTEGLYLRTDGEQYGGTMTFGARWDDDEGKIFFKMYQASAGAGYNVRVGIGTSDPAGELTVKRGYSSSFTPAYIGNTSYTAWNRQVYDTLVVQQDDVTTFRMVEKNGETAGSDQILSFSIGDGLGVIATSAQPLAFYVNGSPSGIGYQGLSGTQVLRLQTNGNAQFYYALTTGGNITVDKSSPTLRLAGSAYGNSGARVQFEGWASGSGYSNWQIDTAFTGNNQLNFVPSTTAGGSTFTTPVFQIDATGIGSFASNLYANGTIQTSASGIATFRARGGSYGASYNTTLRSEVDAAGVLQFGNNNDNYILAGNSGTGGYLIIRVNCTAESRSSGTLALTINSAAAATFASSVTATGFFESSDKRLKTIIEESYDSDMIFNIKPKTYVKEGKKEIGYFAQDFEGVLSSAVTKGDDGYLSLSYTQVHTAKIAIIEDEVDVLKKRVSELESKLLKYES